MRERKSLSYSIVMRLASSPSVRSICAGAKTGRIHSEREEEEAVFSEKRVSEEEEAGRRIRAAIEGETGDWMRSRSGIEISLVVQRVEVTGDEFEGPAMGWCTRESGSWMLRGSLRIRRRPRRCSMLMRQRWWMSRVEKRVWMRLWASLTSWCSCRTSWCVSLSCRSKRLALLLPLCSNV